MDQSLTLTRDFNNLQYQNGYGNHHCTEALENALPKGQNSPQTCPYNLIAEQFSGTAFTVPRAQNQRSWLYRIKPSVVHTPFKPSSSQNYLFIKNNFLNDEQMYTTPNQLRWKPLPYNTQNPKNWLESLITVAGAGDPQLKQGIAIYLYAANKNMNNETFYNSDGDFLIVPQEGTLYITTEMGKMVVKQREICILPRGIKFSIDITQPSRGYVCEVFKGHFKIPDLGPIGANGLANPRDFECPIAFYENIEKEYKLFNKFQGKIFQSTLKSSPYDVVAWHGNYCPYKYNLDNFNTINTVSFDHPDPSIFTVLTCPSDEPGVAVCDFVVFPPRWMVAENTFRPPYFHRNIMSEFMGNISGQYDAKVGGFGPGCSSLHNIMTAHGPETEVFHKMSNCELKPVKIPYENLAFMFETCYFINTTNFAMDDQVQVDQDYFQCWQKLNDLKLGNK
ncbi:hypothetical protein IMG5_168310 [Ichthyophthirius multifiliis]|uniref:homogentisate 1,2-dioxygenase n=1 Tax=Ichthyophthirius multifiliis TaxID=5932 RepID=G0R128_ICHMU|nr:hypothetical protein IMG5_168310 [Ichthyophthirius multifiliis]EGR28795.1 hypothetical protein IMG5_168310 [Ichthyophthirius multifiliis]|eukprot:XP_004030031.1 hypothetical protein IMG5_168310 [Ichthyophthirius multifiliis]